MKTLLYILPLFTLVLGSCKKTEFNDITAKGEGLVGFTLKSPGTGTKLSLNAATPNSTITFSWNESKPGLHTLPSYTLVAVTRTNEAANFDIPLIQFDAGANTSLILTTKQIDDALKAKGVADGAVSELLWSVKATNGDVTIVAQNQFFIDITRMKDGASPFFLLGPASSTGAISINPTATTSNITFNWTRSLPAAGGQAIKYKVLFAERKLDEQGNELPVNWNTPLFAISADNNGADTLATVSYKKLSDSLFKAGFTSLPSPASLTWTVVANSGSWNQVSDYKNTLVIIREVKVYIVGSATPGGWDIDKSLRMTEDARFPGTYFMYVRLIGGGELKFVNGQAWPPAAGAIDWGQDPALAAGNITDNNESNIAVASTGVYRITFDLTNKKYYLQTAVANGIGGMGMIGAFQGWSQPAVKMSYLAPGRFIYLASMSTNDEFKFHDGNDWDNGANNKNRWFAVDNTNGGKMVIDPGSGYDSFKWTGTNGMVRAIWDGSDPLNLTYSLTAAAEMRVVGNGMQGVTEWDPGSSPKMTYTGNGKWTISLTLIAGKEIKFLAGNAWGAFDYEDNSGGSTTTGTARGIKWDGSDNFKTPATTGTYTILLDEYAQTVTIQ